MNANGRAGVRWRLLGVALLGIAQALLLVWGSAADGGAARQLLALVGGASMGAAALLWVAFDQRLNHTPLAWVLGLALLLRLVAVQAMPLLEDDHFRYLWDGLRTATVFDPYRLPPSAFFGTLDLAPRWQDILSGINHPDIPTVYGPVLQYLFALAYWIAPGRLEALQALLLVADMAVLTLLAAQPVARRWLLAYALHPLILAQAMAGAHPDGLLALLLLLALLAWQRRLALWVGVMLGLAVGSKVAALVTLPMLAFAPPPAAQRALVANDGLRWAAGVAVGLVSTLALLYVPFILAGGSDATALGLFGRHWRFNPLFYRAVEAAVPGSALTARVVAALLVIAGVAALTWRWRREQGRTPGTLLPPLHLALCVLLLLSPVVNPWYWLWALALSVYLDCRWVVVASVAAVLSYFNSTVLLDASLSHLSGPQASYAVAWPVTLIQLLLLGAAFVADRRLTTQRV